MNAPVAQVWDFIPVVGQFAIKRRLRCDCELPLQWTKETTHTSRAALRPGTGAVVKISARLDCDAVSPLGSVVMPGSASFKQHTTA